MDNRSLTYQNITDHGASSFNPDGSRTLTYKDLIGPGFTAYNGNGTMSYTFKNVFDNGYTTVNPDGSLSFTYKNVLGRGYTTYHLDGKRYFTTKNITDSGYSTYELKDYQFGPEEDNTGYYSDGGWISNSVYNIVNELLKIDSDIKETLKSIENECLKLTKAINEARFMFYDQDVCINIISLLYSSMQHLNDAESMLHLERKKIRAYIEELES